MVLLSWPGMRSASWWDGRLFSETLPPPPGAYSVNCVNPKGRAACWRELTLIQFFQKYLLCVFLTRWALGTRKWTLTSFTSSRGWQSLDTWLRLPRFPSLPRSTSFSLSRSLTQGFLSQAAFPDYPTRKWSASAPNPFNPESIWFLRYLPAAPSTCSYLSNFDSAW